MSTTSTNPVQSTSRPWQRISNLLSELAGLFCAVHCIVHPFVMGLLTMVGISHDAFMHKFMLFVCALVITTMTISFRRHGKLLPLAITIPGLIILLVGVFYAEDYSIVLHKVMVTLGGILITVASFVNMRMDRKAGHVHRFSLKRK